MLLRSSLAAACLATLAAGQPRVPDAFYVPTSQAAADAMLDLAGVTAKDVVYDLGSGDGRILVVAAQKYGARGVGIEIDPALVARAQAIAREGGVEDKVRFIEGDFFEADLREATVVTLYLSTTTNRRLASKLRAELTPGTRIVSQQFDMGPWEPDRRARLADADLFLWIIPRPRPPSAIRIAPQRELQRLRHVGTKSACSTFDNRAQGTARITHDALIWDERRYSCEATAFHKRLRAPTTFIQREAC